MACNKLRPLFTLWKGPCSPQSRVRFHLGKEATLGSSTHTYADSHGLAILFFFSFKLHYIQKLQTNADQIKEQKKSFPTTFKTVPHFFKSHFDIMCSARKNGEDTRWDGRQRQKLMARCPQSCYAGAAAAPCCGPCPTSPWPACGVERWRG